MTVISYLIKLYNPIEPREKNHKASIGANMKPTLPVPNCCMLNKTIRTVIAVTTTAAAIENKT